MHCNLCGNGQNNQHHTAKEMMFGTRDEFAYLECASCGCLQLLDPPSDMSAYYPDDYYSFTLSDKSGFKADFITKIKTTRDKAAVFKKGIVGRLLNRYYPNEVLHTISDAVHSTDQRILDVGCGKGLILNQLKSIGFTNLLGIDPFIEKEIRYKNGLEIRKMDFKEVPGNWDVIMLHHSFEHMANPAEILSLMNEKLSDGGTGIIRIPVAGSFAWQEYGVDWVQLDAPRHYFLHTEKSMTHLAKKAGLEITQIVYDSTGFQFWGSEQYKRDISLHEDRSYKNSPSDSVFSKAEIKSYQKKAGLLNRQNKGDSAAFFLRKKTNKA